MSRFRQKETAVTAESRDWASTPDLLWLALASGIITVLFLFL